MLVHKENNKSSILPATSIIDYNEIVILSFLQVILVKCDAVHTCLPFDSLFS